MEEYIKVLKGFLNTKVLYGRMALTSSQVDIVKHAIRNLINKYKEQEANLYASNQIINEYIESHKEQQKIIELMAKELARKKGMVKKVCGNFNCEECIEMKFEECIIEFFRKKAKGE